MLILSTDSKDDDFGSTQLPTQLTTGRISRLRGPNLIVAAMKRYMGSRRGHQGPD